ncbi:unnamed protein product [Amoebophrya sp. A120]|nr:unnamed protein product [Amoebophrya sp. A120]|eukprot:GSA120T00023727001.1
MASRQRAAKIKAAANFLHLRGRGGAGAGKQGDGNAASGPATSVGKTTSASGSGSGDRKVLPAQEQERAAGASRRSVAPPGSSASSTSTSATTASGTAGTSGMMKGKQAAAAGASSSSRAAASSYASGYQVLRNTTSGARQSAAYYLEQQNKKLQYQEGQKVVTERSTAPPDVNYLGTTSSSGYFPTASGTIGTSGGVVAEYSDNSNTAANNYAYTVGGTTSEAYGAAAGSSASASSTTTAADHYAAHAAYYGEATSTTPPATAGAVASGGTDVGTINGTNETSSAAYGTTARAAPYAYEHYDTAAGAQYSYSANVTDGGLENAYAPPTSEQGRGGYNYNQHSYELYGGAYDASFTAASSPASATYSTTLLNGSATDQLPPTAAAAVSPGAEKEERNKPGSSFSPPIMGTSVINFTYEQNRSTDADRAVAESLAAGGDDADAVPVRAHSTAVEQDDLLGATINISDETKAKDMIEKRMSPGEELLLQQETGSLFDNDQEQVTVELNNEDESTKMSQPIGLVNVDMKETLPGGSSGQTTDPLSTTRTAKITKSLATTAEAQLSSLIISPPGKTRVTTGDIRWLAHEADPDFDDTLHADEMQNNTSTGDFYAAAATMTASASAESQSLAKRSSADGRAPARQWDEDSIPFSAATAAPFGSYRTNRGSLGSTGGLLVSNSPSAAAIARNSIIQEKDKLRSDTGMLLHPYWPRAEQALGKDEDAATNSGLNLVPTAAPGAPTSSSSRKVFARMSPEEIQARLEAVERDLLQSNDLLQLHLPTEDPHHLEVPEEGHHHDEEREHRERQTESKQIELQRLQAEASWNVEKKRLENYLNTLKGELGRIREAAGVGVATASGTAPAAAAAASGEGIAAGTAGTPVGTKETDSAGAEEQPNPMMKDRTIGIAGSEQASGEPVEGLREHQRNQGAETETTSTSPASKQFARSTGRVTGNQDGVTNSHAGPRPGEVLEFGAAASASQDGPVVTTTSSTSISPPRGVHVSRNSLRMVNRAGTASTFGLQAPSPVQLDLPPGVYSLASNVVADTRTTALNSFYLPAALEDLAPRRRSSSTQRSRSSISPMVRPTTVSTTTANHPGHSSLSPSNGTNPNHFGVPNASLPPLMMGGNTTTTSSTSTRLTPGASLLVMQGDSKADGTTGDTVWGHSPVAQGMIFSSTRMDKRTLLQNSRAATSPALVPRQSSPPRRKEPALQTRNSLLSFSGPSSASIKLLGGRREQEDTTGFPTHDREPQMLNVNLYPAQKSPLLPPQPATRPQRKMGISIKNQTGSTSPLSGRASELYMDGTPVRLLGLSLYEDEQYV